MIKRLTSVSQQESSDVVESRKSAIPIMELILYQISNVPLYSPIPGTWAKAQGEKSHLLLHHFYVR